MRVAPLQSVDRYASARTVREIPVSARPISVLTHAVVLDIGLRTKVP